MKNHLKMSMVIMSPKQTAAVVTVMVTYFFVFSSLVLQYDKTLNANYEQNKISSIEKLQE